MKALRRNQSKKQRAAAAVGDLLKTKSAGKTVKGAKKAAKGTAIVKASKGAAKRTPLSKLLTVAALGAAGIFAAKRRSGGAAPAQ